MSFLAPLWLALAAAAGVPLMLHLLRRNVGARVDFPAARYLQRAEREHSRSLRLRNLLLMLLRVLLVLTLALAAARPFVRGIGVGHGPTAVAVVLDNSLSTTAVEGGSPLFSRLRDGATAVLGAAEPADRLWLVTADGRVRGGDREQLLAELQRIAPIEGAGDLPLALRRAAAAVQGAGLPAGTVAIATDGQQSAWSTATRAAANVAVFVPAGTPPANHAVLDAAADPPRWTPRGAITARIVAPDSVGWRILLGDRTLARGSASRGEPVLVRAAPAERGWVGGRVELEPDDFHADDARWFALWVGAPPAVVVDPSAGAFATTALGALAADGRAILAPGGVRIASADAAGALPVLLVPPADPARFGAANRELARLGIPWRYGAVERGAGLVRGGRLAGIAVSERAKLAPVGAARRADTLATVSGEPWIVSGPGYVLLGSRLDPAATSLPVRAPFVPWLAELLSLRLATGVGDAGAPLAAEPEAPVTLPDGTDALESMTGGRRDAVAGATNAPAERGVWFILARGRRIGALVVNAPAGESALARWDAASLAHRLGGPAGASAVTGEGWRRAAFAAGARRPALVPLLAVALLLLIAEALLVRSARGAAAARSTRSIAA